MDHGQQIKQESFDPTDLFEFTDEEIRQMINLQRCFDVQEEVVVQECFKKDIIIQSLNMNHYTDVDTFSILETEVECTSSTVNVGIPIPKGEEASSSVYPWDFSKPNQASHVMNSVLTNHVERSFCCELCSIYDHRKSDLTKHIKIHKRPNNVSDSSQFTVPMYSQSVAHSEGSKNKGDIYQKPNTKKGNGYRKGQDKKKDLLMTLKLYSKPHTCNPCGLSFTYKNVLLKHARLRHNHDDVNIVLTQKSNSESYELTILANSKLNEVSSYFCDSCEAVYNRFDIFKRHQRLHINIELGKIEGETIRCIDCGLFLKSLPELQLHTEQHLIITNFPKKSKCLVYERKCIGTDQLSDDTSEDNVNEHYKGVTCDILDAEVAYKQAFINQKASHVNTISDSQNIKIFLCDICGKVNTCKYQCCSKLSNQKNSFCFLSKAMSGQFDTDISDHEPVPTKDQKYIQSGMNENDMCYNPMSVTSPSESHPKKFNIVNGKLEKNKQKSSKQVLMDQNTQFSSQNLYKKKQSFVLKGEECTRTCPSALYYSSTSYSNVMNPSLAEESKKNDSLLKPNDQTSENY